MFGSSADHLPRLRLCKGGNGNIGNMGIGGKIEWEHGNMGVKIMGTWELSTWQMGTGNRVFNKKGNREHQFLCLWEQGIQNFRLAPSALAII